MKKNNTLNSVGMPLPSDPGEPVIAAKVSPMATSCHAFLGKSFKEGLAHAKTSHSHSFDCFNIDKAMSIPIISLGPKALEEEKFYMAHNHICRFNGLWPRLVDLHHCISQIWKPMLRNEPYISNHVLFGLLSWNLISLKTGRVTSTPGHGF